MNQAHRVISSWVSALLFLSPFAVAAPMAYFTGGTMVMTEFAKNERELSLTYSLTARDGVGVRLGSMQSMRSLSTQNGHNHDASNGVIFPTHETAEITYTRLLKRWNTEDAQTNIWFVGGMGAIRSNMFDGERLYASPALQIDYETTRIYGSAKVSMHRARDMNADAVAVRAGFSFWEPEFEGTQPWFIMEAKRVREFSNKIEVTSMLRLINRDFFAEAGVNQNGKFRLSLMLVFSNW